MKQQVVLLSACCGLAVVTIMFALPRAGFTADRRSGKNQPAATKGSHGGYGRNATGGAGYPAVAVRTFDELSRALKKGNATILLQADIAIPKNAGKEVIETTAGNITLD